MVLRLLACVLLVLGLSTVASAQTIIDPTTVATTASLDHDATYPDGSFVLTSYRLDVLNSTGTVIASLTLGKPTPLTTGCPTGVAPPCVVVGIASFVSTLPVNTTMTGVVVSLGPGGTNASVPSNPFARAFTLRAPAAVTNVKVYKGT